MATKKLKKLKTRKMTVEEKLRDQNEHLTKSVQEANTRHYNLDQDFKEAVHAVRALFVLVHNAVRENREANNAMHGVLRNYSSMRERTVEDLGIKEMTGVIMQAFVSLAKDFAREDEGTALMEEHKRDLMQIIQTITHDDTRPNAKLERLAITAHNIEVAKKDNRYLNVENPDQYKQGDQGRNF